MIDFLRADFREPKPRTYEHRGWTISPCGHIEVDYWIDQAHAWGCTDYTCTPVGRRVNVKYGILTAVERRN